ncbi:DegV family protein [Jeotgalibaca caeni]|uniref:DegV family protein n=1 Tax=Jeotgalibaca caeni TaxID=3028623 RepID=UPI00237E5CF5|nr:DegV family protein [Jeotgalibaca caeni]MDE1549600.1 DegV family protein [Jeotgalibaca caeni]
MRLIVDSSCDLPLSYLQEHDVEVLPLSVVMGDKEYIDMFEITNEEIYDFIRKGKHPSTSQVNLKKFDQSFRRIAEAGESGLYITLSADLSGTYQAAVLAQSQVMEDYPDCDIKIIDSRTASLGIGLMVREAIQMKENGFTIEEIEERVRFMVEHTVSIFTVQDLNYLSAGGRLSKSSAFFGGLLNIHPLLEVVDGKLVPKDKLRGRRKVLNRMYERLETEAQQLKEQTVLIVHTNDHETVKEMKEHMTQKLGVGEVIDYPIGAVIGAHTGIGTIGIFYLNEFE